MTTTTLPRARSPRTATTSGIQRRERAEQLPLPTRIGDLAGTDIIHGFAPLFPTVGAAQCRRCFGWPDDPRHALTGMRRA